MMNDSVLAGLRDNRSVVLLIAKFLLAVDELHPLLAGSLLQLALESGVVMVLNVVVGTPWQMLGNLGPTVAVDLVKLKDLLVLLRGPLDFLDVGIEMVVPPSGYRTEYMVSQDIQKFLAPTKVSFLRMKCKFSQWK